jgi:CxxC-x17-CxxC domain-containing protein
MGNFNRDSRGGGRDFDRPRFGGGRDFAPRGDRQLFKTVCSNCGKDCEVPFRPTNGKPVYCSDCFEKMGNSRSTDSGRNDFGRNERPAFDQTRAQLDAINVKLERIIRMLEVKVVAPVVEEAPKEKKVKKASVKK